MIGYAMVGISDLERSSDYYDAILAPLGLVQVESDNNYVGYAPKISPSEIEFYATKPFDQRPATYGNGTMIAFAADSRRAVDLFHSTALENGGTDEGVPGPRPADGTIYYAYARDPDGNKICAYFADPELN